MKVKKIIAPSMPEAMEKIRLELGSDAVILNSKVVEKGGIFGFFTKKNIEVIAAVDSSKQDYPPHQNRSQDPIVKEKIFKADLKANLPINKEDNNQLLKEIEEIKLFMKKLSHDVHTGYEHYPEPLREIYRLLVEQEFTEMLRKEIVAELLEKWIINGANAPFKEVLNWLKNDLNEKLSLYDFGGISYKKKYMNIVGPTGVGKTTTLAKIAASCVLKDRKKVGFITTDTYRIAAIDQLKTYAKILGIPFEVCYNINDFRAAKEKFAHLDIVFIDTAGRNFRNEQYVRDLKEIIDFDEEIETYLVLSLTSKYSDMEAIFKQFSLVEINKLIFTKMDETVNYGSMINMILTYKIGIAYLTNGQNVPDDMIKATPQEVVNTVLGVER